MNAALRREWLVPSDSYGWAATLRNIVPLFALLALAPIVADYNIVAAWCLAPALGSCIYRTTVVLHDCTHFTLFKRRRTNKWVGFTLGAITGVDFHGFSRLHWRHHRCYGDPADPQGFHYGHLQRMTSRQFAWHIVKPLLGVNLRYTAMESALAPKNARRLLRTGGFALVALIQVLILSLVTGWGRHWTLAALPFVSAATFGLFFSQLRGIAEHGTVDDRAAPGNVLTHAPHWLDRILLYDVNFNYHAEHHRHPEVPSCHLPELHATVRREPDARQSMLATLRTLHAGLRT